MADTWVMPTHIVACAGVVLNEKNEVLMVKTHNAGWVFPGGQVEEGENLFDAVKREIWEESGIEVEVGEVFCVASNTGKYPGYNGVKEIPTKVMFDFICKPIGGTLGTSDETSESGWFSKEEALKMIIAPAYIERYKAFLEYNGRPTYMEYVTRPTFEMKVKRHI